MLRSEINAIGDGVYMKGFVGIRIYKTIYGCRCKALFFSALFFLCSICVNAQQTGRLLFQRFDAHFLQLDSLIFKCDHVASLSCLQTFGEDNQMYLENAVDSFIRNKVHEQQRAMKAETGLLVSGHSYYRAGDGIGVDPDENDALERYTAKAQVELRWNILSSSLINRKSRLDEISLQGELEQIALEQMRVSMGIEQQKEYFREEYDSLLASVLQLRINNLQLLNDAQLYLTSDRSIGTDELLKIMDEQAVAERLMASIPKEYPTASQLIQPEGKIIQLDTAMLKGYIREHALRLQATDLQIALLHAREKNANYWRSLSLSPFVRYSYYVRPEVSNPSTMDAGVAFQIPLSSQESRRRKALAAERIQKTVEREEQTRLLMEEVELILTEIERANRGLMGELKRIDVLREYMRLRRENYQGHIGEYNFMSRIKEYNHYLTCWENYYSYQYRRDCCIAELQAYLPQQSILEFCIISK